MRFQREYFNKIEKNNWNKFLDEMKGASHAMTWQNIKYLSAFENIKNLSFAVKEGNTIVALVAFGINKSKKENSFSFGNNLLPAPVFRNNISHSYRRKIYDFIFEIIKDKAIVDKIKNIFFISHPIIFSKKKVILSSENQFELISKCESFIVHNTLIHEFENLTEEDMTNKLSKYHKKNIKKINKKKLIFNTINSQNNKKEIKKHFKNLKDYHFMSAGKLTRSNKTWNVMLDQLYDNEADLFSLYYKKKPISYLYCGRYKKFTWGWTQVNLKEYEKEFMPRHLLEWKTLLYYKNKGMLFYEIGERFYKQKNFKPTKKELSISEFKEKYGAEYYPKSEFKIRINFSKK